ncbi:Holliday junction branch migration protein RuvA [Maricaulis sp.]|uniref:Holliday junction branch migration protein RuvA n=1 Tax=Maricaulis sp. TaxID=1486257 RepID=UPI003A9462F2
MIGMLKGVVEAIGAEEAVIDVHGVGYLVGAGTRTLSRLEPGQAVVLHIETHVREDAFKLYGFTDDLDRAWFVRLQEIQGVGAKAALSILDVLPPHELANATALGDKAAFARAKGVGPKLATRIATELKDKAPPLGRSFSIGLPVHGDATAVPDTAPQTPMPPSAGAARDDAVSALLNLGYPESIARQAVATVMRDAGSDAPISDLIRLSLRVLAP